MSRFERKCFIGSATFHGLLLVVFLFGSAFMSKDNLLKDMGPVITMENVKVTDGPTTGGGNPNGNPNPPPPAPAPVQPDPPAPQPPKPEVVKPTPRPEPPKPEVAKVKDTPKPVEKDQGDLPVPVAKKQTPKLTAKTVTRNEEAFQAQQRADDKRRRDEIARANAEAARLKAERQRLADAVNGIVGGTGKSLSKSTVVEPLGPGGQAYVNYGSLVGEIYKRAVYASQPQSDDDAQAHIRVVVARDGTVRSSEWVRRTGSSVLDKAVERAMNSVRSLPAFPAGAKDAERTFNIKIAFDAKEVSA